MSSNKRVTVASLKEEFDSFLEGNSESLHTVFKRIGSLEELLLNYDEMQNRLDRIENMIKDENYTKAIAGNIVHLMRQAGVMPNEVKERKIQIRVTLWNDSNDTEHGYRAIYLGSTEHGPQFAFSDVEEINKPALVDNKLLEEVTKQFMAKYSDVVMGTFFHVGLYSNVPQEKIANEQIA